MNKFKLLIAGRLIRVFIVLLIISIFASCTKIDFFEKTVSFNKHEWSSANKPSINFSVSDTSAYYNLFVVLRHSDAYGYNNIWLNLTVIPPGDTAQSELKEFQLADNKKGWLGSGMDDIFEHRIQVNKQPIKYKAGNYTFILQQMMREDPLEHILNAGIRIEKAK
ncbi:gliding motility lipoprotein GldH [Danxiaibacter flavus]|uniref:Gliding motility lipoprotein GldH n=1 Tax=Danxiaibacter flavus TaxID=3049108 RepID=A0ABV3ZEY0_9BACT|nr:gliding motility lipoprotein GldH [Chitinophagaceae bacterium DXS]